MILQTYSRHPLVHLSLMIPDSGVSLKAIGTILSFLQLKECSNKNQSKEGLLLAFDCCYCF